MNAGGHSIIDSTDNGTRRIATIVRWQHPVAGVAFCLARLVVRPDSAPPVVVLSELAGNPDAAGITGDFGGAATAAAARLGSYADLSRAIWLAHHGEFSSYDAGGAPETLTEVSLTWTGNRYQCDLRDHRLLPVSETAAAQQALGLEPVPAVLSALGVNA